MATQDRPCARDIRNVTYDSEKVSQGPTLRPSILGSRIRRIKNDERSRASLSVFLCRAGSHQIARRLSHYCSGRQKVFARYARCDSRAITNPAEHIGRRELVASSGLFHRSTTM